MISATTQNNVLEHIFSSITYNEIINNIMNNSFMDYSLIDDVKQEIYLQVATCNSDIVDIYNNGDFKWFFIRLCSNQLKSTTSHIYYTYHKKQKMNDEFDADNLKLGYEENFEHDIDVKDKYQYIMGIINNNIDKSADNKRNLTLFKMYHLDDLSMGEISKITGIPKTSVYDYLLSAKIFIQTEINKNLFN